MAQAGGGVTICITDCCCSWGLWWGKGGQHKGSFLPLPSPLHSLLLPSFFSPPPSQVRPPSLVSTTCASADGPGLASPLLPSRQGFTAQVLIAGRATAAACQVKIKSKGRLCVSL